MDDTYKKIIEYVGTTDPITDESLSKLLEKYKNDLDRDGFNKNVISTLSRYVLFVITRRVKATKMYNIDISECFWGSYAHAYEGITLMNIDKIINSERPRKSILSYVSRCIMSAMAEYIKNKMETIYIPYNLNSIKSKVHRTVIEYGYDRDLSEEDKDNIYEYVFSELSTKDLRFKHLSEEQKQKIREVSELTMVSINQENGDIDIPCDFDMKSGLCLNRDKIMSLIKETTNKREYEAIALRYCYGETRTLDYVGKRMKISRERVRQLIFHGFRKCREKDIFKRIREEINKGEEINTEPCGKVLDKVGLTREQVIEMTRFI